MSVFCVWDSLRRDWGNEFLLFVGQFLWVCGSEFVQFVGQFGAGLVV